MFPFFTFQSLADEFADLDDFGSGGRNNGKILGKIVLGMLVVGLISAALYFISSRVLGGSPIRRAEQWVTAIATMDSESVSEQMCANLPLEQQAAFAGATFLNDFLADTTFEIDLGFASFDTDGIVEQLEIDTRRLEYELVSREEDFAVVHVSGPIVIEFMRIRYPLDIDEEWQMEREVRDWKWCGRTVNGN